MSDSDEDSVPSVVKERKGKWRMKGELDNEEDEDDGDTRCPDCVAKEGILEDLKFELNAERDAANETILMVEKMEERQRQEIEKLTLQLNIHKDRVAALTDDLEHERNARMQEIYQIERKTMENDHNMKDYKTMNEKNGNLDKELEAFQNENDTLVQVTEELRQNKLELVEQLRVYEDQVTDLEIKNDDLRKRLYDSDNQKDRHKVYASRMKKKLHDYMNGPTLKLKATRNNNNKSKSQSLGPLKSFDRVSMLPLPFLFSNRSCLSEVFSGKLLQPG